MIITNIEKQKKNENRFSVFIDNKFAFGIDGVDLLYLKIKIGSKLSDKEYNYIIENILYQKAKDKAIKYISYKLRTEKEVYNKLKEQDYDDITIQKVIELLKTYDYINDKEFTKSYIHDKFNLKGYGSERIKYELKSKGVDEQIIKDELNQSNINEVDKALMLLDKKLKGNFDIEFKEKQKIFGFLLRRGFNYDTIKRAFDNYKKEMED